MDRQVSKSQRYFLIAALLSLLLSFVTADDPCASYVLIESSRRGFDSSVKGLPISDKYIIRDDVYYRFTDGKNKDGRLLDIASKVGFGKCGTKSPIFLDGLHPETEASKTMFACEIRSSHTSTGHCENRYEVDITRCDNKHGGYFVYKLKTPLTNDAAYCVDFRSFTKMKSMQHYSTTESPTVQQPLEDNFLLLVADGGIHQTDLITGKTRRLPLNDYVGYGYGVDYLPRQDNVYFIDDYGLKSFQLDGNGNSLQYYDATALVTDRTRNLVYHYDQIYHAFYVMDTSTGERDFLLHNSHFVESAALDSKQRILYWVYYGNNNDFNFRKASADDGTSMETIKKLNTSEYYSNVALTVDETEEKLYWSYGSSIQTSNLDGSGIKTVYHNTSYNHDFSDLKSDATYIYLTDWSTNHMWRLHKTTKVIEPFGPAIYGWLDAIGIYRSDLLKKDSVSVTCNNAEFTVTLDIDKFIAQYPKINPEHLTLGDIGCPHDGGVTKNGSLVWTSAFTDCDMEKKVVDGKVWYMNKLIDQFTDGLIIRDKSFAMNVTCQMDQDVHADISFEAIDEHIKGETVAGNGEFTLTMDFYTDNTFTDPITDVPVEILLGDRTFVQLDLKDATDPALTLVHQETIATPNADFQEGETDPHYYLVKNRCPDDETTVLHESNQTQLRYSFQAFRFLKQHPTVYLHTYVKVCDPGSSSGASCQRICLTSSHHRVARAATADAVHRVFNGPLSLSKSSGTGEELHIDQLDAKKATGFTSASLMLAILAGCVMVSLSLLYVAKRKKQGKKDTDASGQRYGYVQYQKLVE